MRHAENFISFLEVEVVEDFVVLGLVVVVLLMYFDSPLFTVSSFSSAIKSSWDIVLL